MIEQIRQHAADCNASRTKIITHTNGLSYLQVKFQRRDDALAFLDLMIENGYTGKVLTRSVMFRIGQ